jgi:hypothetical protein
MKGAFLKKFTPPLFHPDITLRKEYDAVRVYSGNKRIGSPEDIHKAISKGHMVVCEHAPPAKILQDDVSHFYMMEVEGDLYWIPKYGFQSVSDCKVYRQDGSKVRKGSKLEGAILGSRQDWKKFFPEPFIYSSEEDD